MTGKYPPGDDGNGYEGMEWRCTCSCSRCGPKGAHDCDTRACNSGFYKDPETP